MPSGGSGSSTSTRLSADDAPKLRLAEPSRAASRARLPLALCFSGTGAKRTVSQFCRSEARAARLPGLTG